MRRFVGTVVGLSAAVMLTALPMTGAAQADPKQTPEKKQAPPAAEKKQTPPAEKKQAAPAAGKHVMVTPADLKWGPGPPGLPAGAEIAVLDGDPGKAGLFTIRVKIPDGYMVQPHWHPVDEHVTVLSGNLTAAMGSKWEDSALHDHAAGTYIKMPRKAAHFVKAKGETIFQLTAMGPFEITYVNAKDDPRKKASN